jgi:hypothetical protein
MGASWGHCRVGNEALEGSSWGEVNEMESGGDIASGCDIDNENDKHWYSPGAGDGSDYLA